MLHVLGEFKFYLTNMMQTGKLANTAKDARSELTEQQRRTDDWDGSADGIT